jgi:hypothetical protein
MARVQMEKSLVGDLGGEQLLLRTKNGLAKVKQVDG